jgi:hypothetical protein
VVTTVAHHYNIGRVQTAGAVLSAIAVADRLDEAIAQATNAVTGQQRVLQYEHAGTHNRVEIRVRI